MNYRMTFPLDNFELRIAKKYNEIINLLLLHTNSPLHHFTSSPAILCALINP